MEEGRQEETGGVVGGLLEVVTSDDGGVVMEMSKMDGNLLPTTWS